MVTTACLHLLCLAEVEGLPLDLLGVYVDWLNARHVLDGPAKFGRSLQGEKHEELH